MKKLCQWAEAYAHEGIHGRLAWLVGHNSGVAKPQKAREVRGIASRQQ